MCNQQRLRSACAYAQSDQSLCLLLEYSMIVKLLAEHHMASLSLKSVCICWSESTHVKIPHCWKSHAATQIIENFQYLKGRIWSICNIGTFLLYQWLEIEDVVRVRVLDCAEFCFHILHQGAGCCSVP